MGVGGTPARNVIDEDGLSWSAGGRRLVRDVLDRREGLDGVRKLIDFEEHQEYDTYSGGPIETNIVEHVPTVVGQHKRKLTDILLEHPQLDNTDVGFPTNEAEIQTYVQNRLNFNVQKWKRTDFGVTHQAFGMKEADGTPRTQFSTRTGKYVKSTDQLSAPWEGSFAPTIRGAASAAGSSEFFKRIRAFQRAKDFAVIPPYTQPKESSRFGGTLSKDAIDMWHTNAWTSFLQIRKDVLDGLKKHAHRIRSHPYLNGMPIIPESGFQFGPRNGTKGGGYTEVLDAEDDSSLRRSSGDITYSDGALVDDGSFSGNPDLFYSPNVNSISGETFPDFESDVTPYPYDAFVHQYLCGTQYLYEDNVYDSTTGDLVVDETKQYVFRNMYYDDQYIFADHPEKDFKRVFPTSDFDHLYDYPASKFKPTQDMFDNIFAFEDATDSHHEAEMLAISKTCDADAIAAESTHWEYCPSEFMYVRKSLIGPSKLVHYARDMLKYNTLAATYDVGAITKDSDPVTGLPWLNKAKEDYLYVKSLVHGFHATRDNLLCDQSISLCEDSFEETIRVMNAAAMLQVVGDGTAMCEAQITRLNVFKTRFITAKVLLSENQKWSMLFPIQQMEINLKIMNNSKDLFEGVQAISDFAERATALGNLATTAVQALVGGTAVIFAAALIDEIAQSQPAASDSSGGIGSTPGFGDDTGPSGPDFTGGTGGDDGEPPEGADDQDLGGDSHVCDASAVIWDPLCHTAYEKLTDPGTIGTAMSRAQYQEYVNNGATVHPGSNGDAAFYHYLLPMWNYYYETTGIYKTATELGMETYRIYLEGRSGYDFNLHGHFHPIDISERMTEAVFDSYLSSGRVMPDSSGFIPPLLYTTPLTYREYLEGLLQYDEVTHRTLWGWYDVSDPTHVDYDPFADPESLEMKPNNFIIPSGYADYGEFIRSRSNYFTALEDMYTLSQFNGLGMAVSEHSYTDYIRSRNNYNSTIVDMLTRSEYDTLIPLLHTGFSYEIYRIERSDYDEYIHSWNASDELSMNYEVVSVTGENGWKSVKRLELSSTHWYPDTTNSGHSFFEDITNDDFDGFGSISRPWPSNWDEICFTRSSADGTIDKFVYTTKAKMEATLRTVGWYTGTALRTQDGTNQTYRAYNNSNAALRSPMIHSGHNNNAYASVVYEEHYVAAGTASESGVYQPKLSMQYDVYVRSS